MSYINGERKIIKERDENIYHSSSHTPCLSQVPPSIRQRGGRAVTQAAALTRLPSAIHHRLRAEGCSVNAGN